MEKLRAKEELIRLEDEERLLIEEHSTKTRLEKAMNSVLSKLRLAWAKSSNEADP